MAKNNPPDENALFQQAMKGVRRLKTSDKAKLIPSKPKPTRRIAKQTEISKPCFSEYSANEPVTGEATLSFNRGGLQQNYLRKLRRGQLTLEATLDLHGLTVLEAENRLYQFLLDCQAQHKRYICIIHGKGANAKTHYPRLKNKVNNWLQQLPEVLAFHSAQPKDGGTGAVYVILKSPKS